MRFSSRGNSPRLFDRKRCGGDQPGERGRRLCRYVARCRNASTFSRVIEGMAIVKCKQAKEMRHLKQLGLSARGSTNCRERAVRNCSTRDKTARWWRSLFKSHSIQSRRCDGRRVAVFVTLNFKSRFGNAACQEGGNKWQWLTSKAPKGRARDTWHSRRRATGRGSWSSTLGGV